MNLNEELLKENGSHGQDTNQFKDDANLLRIHQGFRKIRWMIYSNYVLFLVAAISVMGCLYFSGAKIQQYPYLEREMVLLVFIFPGVLIVWSIITYFLFFARKDKMLHDYIHSPLNAMSAEQKGRLRSLVCIEEEQLANSVRMYKRVGIGFMGFVFLIPVLLFGHKILTVSNLYDWLVLSFDSFLSIVARIFVTVIYVGIIILIFSPLILRFYRYLEGREQMNQQLLDRLTRIAELLEKQVEKQSEKKPMEGERDS